MKTELKTAWPYLSQGKVKIAFTLARAKNKISVSRKLKPIL